MSPRLPNDPPRVVLLGTGSVIPSARRLATSNLFLSGEDKLLVDCGPGCGHRLAEAGFAPKEVTRILLTHLHVDHCLELAPLALAAFLQGRTEPLRVYGPPGTTEHVEPADDGHETRTPCFADTVQMARSWGGLDAGHLEAVRSQVDESLSRLKPAGSESPIRVALEEVTPRIEPGAPPTVRLDGRVRVSLR